MSNSAGEFLSRHAELAERNNSIDPALNSRYNTKRGLRNEDGTGVLVGLTEIGDVRGYIIEEEEKVPVEGQLLYRGINVTDLVRGFQEDRRFGFEEAAYLILFGELPTQTVLEEFAAELAGHRGLPEGFTQDMILSAPSSDIMNKLARSVLALYSYDDNPEDQSLLNVVRQSVELIARFPTLVAYGYQAKNHYFSGESLHIHSPREDLSTAENLLQLIRPSQEYTPLEADVLDLALMLHAEHGGGNNSAFSIHVVSSAATDTYSAVATGVGSLKGAKHGGAATRVRLMMDDIKSAVSDWTDEDEIAGYLEKMLRKEVGDGSGLIYGMGHAVYTLSDPRAVLLKERAEYLAKEKGQEREMALYRNIERIAPQVLARVKGNGGPISANVDFYSGFVYSMLNIPPELYTPIFAVARIVGWCAHRIEEIVSGGKIIRPAYKNVIGKRSYRAMADR
ncbi:MAG: citrate/2-methylcitrate synthase [Spirochaetaceae bacterium]